MGERNSEFTYNSDTLYENIEYFKKCYNAGLSEYKALLFLCDYINGDYEI